MILCLLETGPPTSLLELLKGGPPAAPMPANPAVGGSGGSEKMLSPPTTLPARLLELFPKPRRLLVSHHFLRPDAVALDSATEEAPSSNCEPCTDDAPPFFLRPNLPRGLTVLVAV